MAPNPVRRGALAACVGAGLLSGGASTAAGYMPALPYPIPGTGGFFVAGPVMEESLAPVRDQAPAILELRRLSGLTFDELASLLGVNRRTLHNWANGRRVGASEASLYRLLSAMRQIDRGEAVRNRRLLLEPGEGGRTLLDFLKEGRVEEAERRAGRGPGRAPAPAVPLAAEARAARAPRPPVELLSMSDEPIATPVERAVRVRPVRLPKDAGRA